MTTDQRVALVTGATSGIGAATARALAAQGADVVVAGRSAERGKQVVAQIESLGRRALFAPHDLEDDGSPERLAALVEAEFGRLDVLVNNAGDFAGGPFLRIDRSTYDRLFTVNVRALFFLTQAVLPLMLRGDGGRVISTSTNAAQMGVPGGSLYGATRAAVDQLARAWAVEFGSSGVTFNTVAAGYIDTPLAHEKGVLDDPEAMAGVLAAIPAGRVARPEEVAAAIAYLASADAGYTTGVTLRVDGGLVIA